MEKAPGHRPGASSYQRDAIHLGIPPRTPQGTSPLTRISGFTRTHPRRRAGKAGGLLSFTKRISREPPVNGLSRHILAKAPVFHVPLTTAPRRVPLSAFSISGVHAASQLVAFKHFGCHSRHISLNAKAGHLLGAIGSHNWGGGDHWVLLFDISQCIMSVAYLGDSRDFNRLWEPRKLRDKTVQSQADRVH